MGRKLAFDRNEALQKAMESFWENGYEATSMRALADALGLHLGSVYNALGNKEKVFEEALRLNIDTHVLPRLEAMENAKNPVAGIHEFLTNIAKDCTRTENMPGCFILNSMQGITNINDDVTGLVRNHISRMEESFIIRIEKAQAQCGIDQKWSPEKLGAFLISTIFAMRILGKLGLPGDSALAVRDCAMQTLLAPPPEKHSNENGSKKAV